MAEALLATELHSVADTVALCESASLPLAHPEALWLALLEPEVDGERDAAMELLLLPLLLPPPPPPEIEALVVALPPLFRAEREAEGLLVDEALRRVEGETEEQGEAPRACEGVVAGDGERLSANAVGVRRGVEVGATERVPPLLALVPKEAELFPPPPLLPEGPAGLCDGEELPCTLKLALKVGLCEGAVVAVAGFGERVSMALPLAPPPPPPPLGVALPLASTAEPDIAALAEREGALVRLAAAEGRAVALCVLLELRLADGDCSAEGEAASSEALARAGVAVANSAEVVQQIDAEAAWGEALPEVEGCCAVGLPLALAPSE